MSAPERDPLEWVRRAESDLLNIENNLKSSRVPCGYRRFSCTTSLRKVAQGFPHKEWPLAPRTHDLIVLANMCEGILPDDKSLLLQLEKLMLLFGSRYPDHKVA